jgi:hypothetical protein
MRNLTPEQKTDLESMIDGASLYRVIEALVEICHEKAEHMSSNWQDKALAKDWTDCGKRLDVTCGRILAIDPNL